MVIRDLTLRSAASFGSFHLIRLLYDEYMYYLVEHRVAQAKVVTPIAVMGEVCVRLCSLAGARRCVDQRPVLSLLQFAGTLKSRVSPDLEKGEPGPSRSLFSRHQLSCFLMSEEEEEDEEESDDETRDLVLQSGSLNFVDEEKDATAPPAKQPRVNLNLQ